MRVKITKTVHINDLAGETRRMLDGIKNRVMYSMPDNISEIVKMSLSSSGDEYFRSIEMIESFRKELSTLDDSLQEVQNIIQGYKEAVMPHEPPQPAEVDEEWHENEQAEYEKFMSQVANSEEGFDEEG
jgi:hypothetical protein